METIWYALLGAAFATYLALGGCDYGVGLLLDRRAPEAARRATLNALGPFFLGNEVWLVVTAGLLFGAFPALEGELLSGLFPLVGAGVAGAVLVTVGVGLRSRPAGARQRAGWDALITAGSVLAAGGWGAVLGGLLQGVPPGGPTAAVLTPFTAGTGLAVLALCAAQGATFL
ncbi:MAG TPA: cytochrome d ubiquinol oxidase subunit II, partial [Pilimelia sp.]|nr:cytochrome d ubiquinol oxidase subunit II [Pilimelia sp.]